MADDKTLRNEDMLRSILDKVTKIEKENENLKNQNEKLKQRFDLVQPKIDRIPDMESTIEQIAKRNRLAEDNPEPVDLVKEPGFKGKVDKCPY